MVVIRSLACVRGPVSHRLANLATTLGHYDQARSDFEDAQRIAGAAGTRPYLAWVEYDHARMLVCEGNASSQDLIAGLAGGAALAARSLGMDWLAVRADAIDAAMAP